MRESRAVLLAQRVGIGQQRLRRECAESLLGFCLEARMLFLDSFVFAGKGLYAFGKACGFFASGGHRALLRLALGLGTCEGGFKALLFVFECGFRGCEACFLGLDGRLLGIMRSGRAVAFP